MTSINPSITIVTADHPSLDQDVERFTAGLRSERRSFGPSARANPKPFPSLITALNEHDGFRLATIECGRIVGLVRVDPHGQVFMAISPEYRSRGIGTVLCRTALERARELGYARLVITSRRRGTAVRRLAERLGCTVVEGARGRTDLILTVSLEAGDRRTA